MTTQDPLRGTADDAADYVLVHPALPRRLPDAVSRMIIAFVAALIALSSIAAVTTPARADSDSDRILKAIVGIGAVAIIANELDRKSDRNNDWRDQPSRYRDDWRDDSRDGRMPPRFDDRYRPSRADRIPGSCAIDIDAGRGRSGTVYAESCLRRSGIRDAMPRGCGHDIRVEGRRDRVYSEQCLRDAGFRTRR